MLKPLPGRVLIELREKYSHVATTEGKYDTKTSGICLTINDDDSYPITNRLVFWDEYKDGVVIERDGKKYAFIKIEDLDGYEDVEA